MHLATVLELNHGFATRGQLRRGGMTDYAIRKELERGTLVAFGRDLVARHGASATLVRAASMGARVACVTAARAMGLWVLDDGFHVVARSPNARFRSDGRMPEARLHWNVAPVEPDRHRIIVESGRNALAHIARCQPLDIAAATFDSAVSKGLITLEELQRLASLHRGRFAEVVALVTGDADSGLETLTRVRLQWAGIGSRAQVVVDGHPVDLLIGRRLIIQLDGRQHLNDPAQLMRDRAQDRRLKAMGYTVLRYGYADVVFRWDAMLAEILAHVALAEHA
ncbi:MAG: endonuclease domain-containing protein [Microbacteriaceae bacterium]|nr:endonuclease domain-containing protein [Microbacteriaceae bacterium]MCL2794100.1 endonuclease domain-containing protein [Microbacteriaceae bacterium]